MSAWITAVIAAGSAIAGGAVTGWFVLPPREREIPRAGDHPATALTAAIRMLALEEQHHRDLLERRRAYCAFAEAAQVITGQRTAGGPSPVQQIDLVRAFGPVQLLGPATVADAARAFVQLTHTNPSPDDLEREQQGFLAAAADALTERPSGSSTEAESTPEPDRGGKGTGG